MQSNASISSELHQNSLENNQARNGERRIIFSKCSSLNGNVLIISLQHPRKGIKKVFLLKKDNWDLYEVVRYNEDHRSWFIEDTVKSNGNCYMISKFDPLFLVLPFLRAAKKLEPLPQILKQQDLPQLSMYVSHAITSNGELKRNLGKIADQKGSADLNVWQYNEGKTLKYLSDMVQRVCDSLIEEKVLIEGGAISGNYVKTTKKDLDRAIYLQYSHGMVSEYIAADLSDKLRKYLCIPMDTEEKGSTKKRCQTDEKASLKKKMKVDDREILDLHYAEELKLKASATSKETKPNFKQKALAKSAEGSRNITSFFRKK